MTTHSLPSPPPLTELLDRGTVAVFADFDGTLIEIASGPDAIAVPDNLAKRLEALSQRLEGRFALVSGRGLDNIEQHVGPLHLARAGSHGAHRVQADGKPLGNDPQPLDADTMAAIRNLAEKHGALFERKAHGAALHFRANPDAGKAIVSAAEGIAHSASLIAKHGKCVVELVRPGAEKGAAVRAFMAQAPFVGSAPVFLGDDVTDEDGFAAAAELGGFGIAVGERPSHDARYHLPSVKDVHAWLTL